jgi:energy-converting hydrogenase Eha subunit A
MDPLSPLEQLHLYLGITPYLTRHQLKLLESVAASILTLTIKTAEKPARTGWST